MLSLILPKSHLEEQKQKFVHHHHLEASPHLSIATFVSFTFPLIHKRAMLSITTQPNSISPHMHLNHAQWPLENPSFNSL